MNKFFIIIFVMIFSMLHGQEKIGTLYQMEECSNRVNYDEEGCPDLENITYVKDIDNRLNKFVGVWKGNYDGNTYEFRFEKKEKFGEYSVKWDVLIGRVIIKNSSNAVIYNTLNAPDNKTYICGNNFQRNTYVFYFTSVNNGYCNDLGAIFAEVKKDNPKKMRLYFDRDKVSFNPKKCPNYQTYKTTLSENIVLLLTKQ